MSIEVPQLNRQKHQWVIRVLQRSGAYRGEPAPGVYAFDLTGRLRELLGREQVTLTFHKNLAAEGVELAAPGSWFHDRLLGYSEEWGSVSHLYLRPREGLDRGALLQKAGLAAPRKLNQRRYQVLLRYSLRTVYYTAPLIQELLNLVFDPVRGRCYKRPFAQAYLDEAASTPDPETGLGFLPNPDKGFAPVWKVVAKEVDRRVGEIQKQQVAGYEDNMSSLKRYYRQLIEDEGGGRHGRPKNVAEAREKTELLKLEWQRRVNEEMDQLKPQVGATLVALAGLHVPMEQWTLEDRSTVWLDPVRDAVLSRAPRKAKATSR